MRKKPTLTVKTLIWLLGWGDACCCQSPLSNSVQEGEFWLLSADEDASTLRRTLLQTTWSETEAENLNITEQKCDMKQSVQGIWVTKMKKAGWTLRQSFLSLVACCCSSCIRSLQEIRAWAVQNGLNQRQRVSDIPRNLNPVDEAWFCRSFGDWGHSLRNWFQVHRGENVIMGRKNGNSFYYCT